MTTPTATLSKYFQGVEVFKQPARKKQKKEKLTGPNVRSLKIGK